MSRHSEKLLRVGAFVLRYSLVFFFVAFGLYKFTAEEAQGIQPLMANSPLFNWLYLIFDVRGASNLIGVVEITAGILIASRHWAPKYSAIGSIMAAFALICTLSFLFTTPGVGPDMQGFLMKDLTLLGAALWTAGEAMLAASFRTSGEHLGNEDAAFLSSTSTATST
jgi:reactive chlorine resistance protein C